MCQILNVIKLVVNLILQNNNECSLEVVQLYVLDVFKVICFKLICTI